MTPYRDRTPGLIVFGVLQLLGGLLALVLLAFMVLGATMASSLPTGPAGVTPAPSPLGTMVLVSLQYAGVAALLFTLGVGSMLGRRWARALSLVVAWFVLVGGVYGTAALLVIWPAMESAMAQALGDPGAEGMLSLVRWFTTGCLVFFMVLLPAIFVLFYRSPHVKATCEHKDPKARWTDHRPLPVLGLSILLATGLLSPIYLLAWGSGGFLAIGVVLRGGAAFAVAFVMAAVAAWSAWRVWLLDLRGWWVGLVYWLALSGASVRFMTSGGQRALLEELDLPAEQLEMMHAVYFSNPAVLVLMATGLLGMVGFFLFTRRYFDSTREAA